MILIYFTNVRSLLPKIDDLRAICSVYSPDVVCIVESWLDDTIDDAEILVEGYSVSRLDRNRHGGGVILYVKNIFSCKVMYKGSPQFECIIVSVRCTCFNNHSPDFSIALFYRPPNSEHA